MSDIRGAFEAIAARYPRDIKAGNAWPPPPRRGPRFWLVGVLLVGVSSASTFGVGFALGSPRHSRSQLAIIRSSHRPVPRAVSADCPLIRANAVSSVTLGAVGTTVTVSGSIYYRSAEGDLVIDPTLDYQAWWDLNPEDYPSVALQANAIAAGATPAPTESTPAPTESTPAPTESTPAPTESGPTMIGDYRPNGACAFLLNFRVPDVVPGTYPVSVIQATSGVTTVYGSFEFTVV